MEKKLNYQIVPAILTDDAEVLVRKFSMVDGLVDWVEIDIIDGKFVNNQTVNLADVGKLSIATTTKLSAHLMVVDPINYLEACSEAKIKRVAFQIEGVDDVGAVTGKAKSLGLEVGISLSVDSPASAVKDFVDQIDFVLVMGVEPGFSGQQFIPDVLSKVEVLRSNYPLLDIAVDGGVNSSNIRQIVMAGANILVMSSEIFNSDNIAEKINQLISLVKNS